jgi:hypothetical protein
MEIWNLTTVLPHLVYTILIIGQNLTGHMNCRLSTDGTEFYFSTE